MGPVTRLVQTSIGLAAELKAAKKERKASESSNGTGKKDLPSIPSPDKLANQKEDIQISEKSKESGIPPGDEQFIGGGGVLDSDDPGCFEGENAPPPYSPSLYVDGVLESAEDIKEPSLSFEVVPPRLSCPVVIPQRSPGSKGRGFMRAYAPVLADYDFGEESLLAFLKSFHKASMASPVLNVITIGAGAIGNIPEPVILLAAMSIQALSVSAAEIQSRNRANNFLTEANEKVFKPRGLFCLVMSFRPNDVPKGDVAMAQVDTSNTVLKWLEPPKSGINMKSSNLRSSSGVTHGELEMPETAPLIYADTGYAEISKPKDEESARGSLSSSRKITRNYFDKRAQAKYGYKHPDSALALERKPDFASKYGDPTHPSVTTGYTGRVSAAVKGESLIDRQARKRAQASQPGSARGAIRRILPTSVLYLMIVNLPTEEEVAEAQQAKAERSRRPDYHQEKGDAAMSPSDKQ